MDIYRIKHPVEIKKKFLLDGMLLGLKEYLQENGWEVVTVLDLGKQSADDADVRKYAKENGLTLITQDKKSADIAKRNGVNCIVISFGDIYEIVRSKIYSQSP